MDVLRVIAEAAAEQIETTLVLGVRLIPDPQDQSPGSLKIPHGRRMGTHDTLAAEKAPLLRHRDLLQLPVLGAGVVPPVRIEPASPSPEVAGGGESDQLPAVESQGDVAFPTDPVVDDL